MKFTYTRFDKCIQNLEAMSRFQDGVSECAAELRKKNTGIDVELFLPSLDSDVVDLLALIMGDKDDWISYFVYELDFGRNYKDGMITNADGSIIKLATSRDLWTLLTKKD